MIKILSIIVYFSVVMSSAAETVYKTTNPDGSTNFTDRKSLDSEKVKINKTQTYKAPSTPSLPLVRKKLSPSVSYTIQIVRPAQNADFINTDSVPVSILMQPKLNTGDGHQIRYQLAEQTMLSKSLSHTFNNVYRGLHEVKVMIVDKNDVPISPVVATNFNVKRYFKKKK